MRTCRIVDFTVPADPRVKLKESEKKDEYLDLAREQKKTVEHEGDGDSNLNCALGTVTKVLVKGLEDLEIRGQAKNTQLQHCWDRPEY